MLEVGDKIELVFSTMYVDGLCSGLTGVVIGLDGTDITSVLQMFPRPMSRRIGNNSTTHPLASRGKHLAVCHKTTRRDFYE